MTRPPKSVPRRIADILLVFPIPLLVAAFNLPGQPGLTAIVCAHVCLYTGFGLAVVADRLARQPFERILLLYLLLMGFVLAATGPIVAAAGPAIGPIVPSG